jgi:hypothetical protein
MTASSCDLSGCQSQAEREQRFAAWLLAFQEDSLFNLERSLRARAEADGLDEETITEALACARECNATAMNGTLLQFRELFAQREST